MKVLDSWGTWRNRPEDLVASRPQSTVRVHNVLRPGPDVGREDRRERGLQLNWSTMRL